MTETSYEQFEDILEKEFEKTTPSKWFARYRQLCAKHEKNGYSLRDGGIVFSSVGGKETVFSKEGY